MRWHDISRRGFLRGIGAAAATGAAVSILPGCTNTAEREVPEPMVVDSDDAINVLEEFEEAGTLGQWAASEESFRAQIKELAGKSHTELT